MEKTITKDKNMEFHLLEYQMIFNDLARYDSQSQKSITFFSIIITVLFSYGMKENINEVFLALPLLLIIYYSFLLNNSYAYLIREKYIMQIENMLSENSTHFFSEIVQNLYYNKKKLNYLNPFSFLIITITIICTILIFFCFYKISKYYTFSSLLVYFCLLIAYISCCWYIYRKSVYRLNNIYNIRKRG